MGDTGYVDQTGVCSAVEDVAPADAGDQRLAYSEVAEEWNWLSVEPVFSADDGGHSVPVRVFVMVQAFF